MLKMTRPGIACVLILCFLGSANNPSYAQASPLMFIGEILLGSNKVRDILNDAESKVNNIMYNGEQASNRVLSDAAAKMYVLIQDLKIALNDQLDKTFNELDRAAQNAFLELNRIIDDANDQ